MGLRCLLCMLAAVALGTEATSLRRRRQTDGSQSLETRAYQPPLLSLGAPPPVPVASSATLQNSYQPPISLIRSNEYQSPLSPQQPAGAPRTYQSQGGSQTYHQSQSVQYIPPQNNPQHSFSVFQQSAPNSFVPPLQPATSYSVHQQPQTSISQGGQSFAVHDSGLPKSTAERTYSSSSSKVVGSHVPAQAIHKAPASEIQGSDKSPAAKEKDKSNDEYVVYYYYYYDNDTAANNNLSLNFDDIPSLEGYDNNDKSGKEPEKSASARTLAANVNSISDKKDNTPSTETSSSSQPRSVGDVYGRPGGHSSTDDTLVQPLKPVSNVFRYGSNEVPRFPVLPNFIVTEVPTTVRPEVSTLDSLATEPPTTQPADLKTGDDADDDDFDNSVLDNASDLLKSADEDEPTTTTTTTTTTTEPPTTTEEPTTTTTTERPSRRRPSLGGGRRRFNSSPSSSSSFNSNRNRQASSGRSTTSSSTTSTTTTTTSTPTRRSFQGNRIRPRPAIGSNRPRPGSRSSTTEVTGESSKSSSESSTTPSSTTSRSRFTSAAPRRFQSSRSRSQQTTSSPSGTTRSSTTRSSTTRAPSSSVSRSRPTSRPRPNLISRNRPPRPGFLRPRPGSQPEEPEETTTTAAPAPETSPEVDDEELSSTDEEDNETEEEDDETSVEETEEPTTTEASRFSALFRPRNRNALGNRPRPVIGNRPSRS